MNIFMLFSCLPKGNVRVVDYARISQVCGSTLGVPVPEMLTLRSLNLIMFIYYMWIIELMCKIAVY